jgi:hypothetical protein
VHYSIVVGDSTTSATFAHAVSANGRYLIDRSSNPWFMVGDSAWGLSSNISVADMTTYFSTRASQGFNCVLAEFVTDTYSGISTTNAQTFDGINAFTGTVSGSPDLTTPNTTYWARMDQMVAIAASYGITLLMVPADTSNAISVTYMMTAARANGHTSCVTFGNFLGNRYKTSPNVIWMHGNDYVSGADDTYVAGIMQGIQAVWPASLNTVEYTTGVGATTYSLQASSAWTTAINFDQAYPTSTANVYTIENSAYAASPTMPLYMGEWSYEGSGGPSNFQLRQSEYWSTLSGALGGYVYGSLNVFPFGTGWQAALSTTAVTELGYWAAMFRGLNWQTLAPDTGNTFLTGGFSSGNTLALGAVDPAGSLGVVYAVTTNPVVAMTKMRGSTTARWYDPTAGTYATIGSFANTGSHTFTLPSAHGDGNSDYALVLTA